MKIYINIIFSSLSIVFCSGHATRAAYYDRMVVEGSGTLCTDNPFCVASGVVEGTCCPNENGEYLGCCTSGDHLPYLVSFGGEPPADVLPLQRCQGDCDVADCDDGLVCYQRGRGGKHVPGCRGGEDDVSKTDYCILEDHFPTHPTHIPIAPADQPSKQPTLPPTPEPISEPTSEQTDSPTHCPSSHPSLSGSSCSNNARCNALDLEGECCPSSEGAFLDCCGQGEITEASCSKNPMCAHLTGQCCPTEQGVFLACCNADRN